MKERLHVRRLGAGPRVVALHGGPGLDHRILLPLAERLASRHEVVLPDLPGHGESPPSDGARPGLRETLALLEAWLLSLSGTTHALLGHSMGAWLAAEIVRRRRVRPGALVLVNPVAEPPATWRLATPSSRPRGGNAHDAALAALLAHVEWETGEEPSRELAALLGGGCLRPASAHAELLRVLHRTLAEPAEPFDPGCPVLVLGGERDRTTPPSHARKTAQRIRGAACAILPDEGHYPFLVAGSGCVPEIERFLETK